MAKRNTRLPPFAALLLASLLSIVVIVVSIFHWTFVKSYAPEIDFAMQIITIIAFVLAFVAYLDAKEQSKQLGSIYESVYTKYIGTFPKHIELLVKHVSTATNNIYIAWDAVDIGSYVSPALHEEFLSEIVKAAIRIRTAKGDEWAGVKFLILGTPQAISSAGGTGQTSTDTGKRREFCRHVAQNNAFLTDLPNLFEKYAASSGLNFANDIEPLRNAHSEKALSEKTTAKQFAVYQLCYHDFVANLLHMNGVDVRILLQGDDASSPPPNFFWVTDDGAGDAQGGFLLPASSTSAPAFKTSDPNLLGNLVDVFKEHFGGAVEYMQNGKALP